VDPVIEIAMYFELLPGKDQKAYAELAKAVVAMALEAPGIVEVRGFAATETCWVPPKYDLRAYGSVSLTGRLLTRARNGRKHGPR
jgi:hypothetical protein